MSALRMSAPGLRAGVCMKSEVAVSIGQRFSSVVRLLNFTLSADTGLRLERCTILIDSCVRRAYASLARQGFAPVAPLLRVASIRHGWNAGRMGFCNTPAARVEKRDCVTSEAMLVKPQVWLLCYARFANATDGSVGVAGD